MRTFAVRPLSRHFISIVVLVVLTGTAGYGAPPSRQFAWCGVYAEYAIGSRNSFSLDMQARYEYTDGDWFQWLIRAGLIYKRESGWQFTGGLARFAHYPDPNGKTPRPEWRPWEEVGRKIQRGHHTFFPRLRLEQRFIRGYNGDVLADHYSFTAFRTRTRLDYTYRFDPAKKTGFSLTAGGEALFATRTFSFTALDQLRATGGAGYGLSDHVSVQLAYLWIFQQKSAAAFEHQHISRLTLQLQF